MEDQGLIDISGLNKVALLALLCDMQVPASFFTNTGLSLPGFDQAKAAKAIEAGFIDYFCGTAIKTDLRRDFIDPWLYDRDAGAGAFARAVAALRNKIKQNKKMARRFLKTELKQLILDDRRAYYDSKLTKGDILGPAQQWTTKMTYKWPFWKQALLIAFGMFLMLVFVAVATKTQMESKEFIS